MLHYFALSFGVLENKIESNTLLVSAGIDVSEIWIAGMEPPVFAEFLCHHKTQTEITLAKLDKDTERLAVSMNHLLEKYRYIGQQIERNDGVFKDTITSLSHDLRTPLATANLAAFVS